jgi:hypothetical protein
MNTGDLLLAIVVALATGGGAAVGAIFSARASHKLEEARFEREQRRLDDGRRVELVQAARALRTDLAQWHARYKTAAEAPAAGGVSLNPGVDFRVWDDYMDCFAAVDDEQLWLTVASAYGILRMTFGQGQFLATFEARNAKEATGLALEALRSYLDSQGSTVPSDALQRILDRMERSSAPDGAA